MTAQIMNSDERAQETQDSNTTNILKKRGEIKVKEFLTHSSMEYEMQAKIQNVSKGDQILMSTFGGEREKLGSSMSKQLLELDTPHEHPFNHFARYADQQKKKIEVTSTVRLTLGPDFKFSESKK